MWRANRLWNAWTTVWEYNIFRCQDGTAWVASYIFYIARQCKDKVDSQLFFLSVFVFCFLLLFFLFSFNFVRLLSCIEEIEVQMCPSMLYMPHIYLLVIIFFPVLFSWILTEWSKESLSHILAILYGRIWFFSKIMFVYGSLHCRLEALFFRKRCNSKKGSYYLAVYN